MPNATRGVSIRRVRIRRQAIELPDFGTADFRQNERNRRDCGSRRRGFLVFRCVVWHMKSARFPASISVYPSRTHGGRRWLHSFDLLMPRKRGLYLSTRTTSASLARSDGGAEIVLDDKISIFVVETPDAVIKALDHG
jgi:hypothetical protein